MLEEIGIVASEHPDESRKLILPTNHDDIELVIIRATDVPTYVQFGAADMGVVGKDGLSEHGGEGIAELLDLNISKCRLMTAVTNEEAQRNGQRKSIRVASKYVNLARRYYESRGIQAQIIKLYGSMELAPLVGLADEIVDLVETGSTLKANNLVAKDLIMHSSCRLIANAASIRVNHDRIKGLTDQIAAIVPRDGADS